MKKIRLERTSISVKTIVLKLHITTTVVIFIHIFAVNYERAAMKGAGLPMDGGRQIDRVALWRNPI